jgi:hypothetical protein
MNNILICILVILYAYLFNKIISQIEIDFFNNKNNIKIFQSSPPHTGSTVLVNFIHGFLCPEEPIYFNNNKFWIQKTHKLDIDNIMAQNSGFDCYFIMSERNDSREKKLINNKYRNYPNVLIFNYNEIKNTTDSSQLNKITDNVFYKIKKFLPKSFFIEKDDVYKRNMTNRIQNMNKKYEEIKNKPFSYFDTFYHIHGSHKNR